MWGKGGRSTLMGYEDDVGQGVILLRRTGGEKDVANGVQVIRMAREAADVVSGEDSALIDCRMSLSKLSACVVVVEIVAFFGFGEGDGPGQSAGVEQGGELVGEGGVLLEVDVLVVLTVFDGGERRLGGSQLLADRVLGSGRGPLLELQLSWERGGGDRKVRIVGPRV